MSISAVLWLQDHTKVDSFRFVPAIVYSSGRFAGASLSRELRRELDLSNLFTVSFFRMTRSIAYHWITYCIMFGPSRQKKPSETKESRYLSLLPQPVALFDTTGTLIAANHMATVLYQGIKRILSFAMRLYNMIEFSYRPRVWRYWRPG